MHFDIDWIDHRREPKEKPNPAFPEGIDIDLTHGAKTSCEVALPYPARRCGVYIIACKRCRLKVGITTAGRSDDPRSVKLACKEYKQ
jgi:hypothetical protein